MKSLTYKRPTIRVYPSTCKGKPCFRFRVVGRNGEVMATSEAYPRQRSAARGARALVRAIGKAVIVGPKGYPL